MPMTWLVRRCWPLGRILAARTSLAALYVLRWLADEDAARDARAQARPARITYHCTGRRRPIQRQHRRRA